jgi:signal transduction histidine kinase
MRAEVADITVSGLDRRVSQPTTDDEIRLLADTLNDMLVRLESGTRAQRDFVSAASHELRTPIAVIRNVLEVAQSTDAPDWREIADSVLEEDVRMERLVDDLLLIARTDAGVSRGEHWTAVDLDDIVFEEARRVPSLIQIDVSRVSAGQVNGDVEQLRRVVRNLLDNALRHATQAIAVDLSSVGGRVSVAVDDDGPGVAPEDRTRIFERFVRLDESRTRSDGGTGLGLAIVTELVDSFGGEVHVESSERLGGARFVFTLPDARA